jgi:glycosyltransferase involved in cell wall biosynthesis
LPSISTSWNDVDGVPTAMIEAALFKLPIVTTDAGSITDLITNSENGILVPQKDSEALAYALEKLIFDESLRIRLGENVYKKAKEMFDLEKNVKELEKLILS